MISWAEETLRAGVNGEATSLLAGADFEEPSEVYRLFEEAMAEQGLRVPSEECRLDWIEVYLCDFLLKGEIGPDEAFGALYKDCVGSECEDRFMIWSKFSDTISCLEDGLGGVEPFEKMTMKTKDEFLLREAGRVVEKSSITLFEEGSKTS